jgi:ATP-binding cassette subfamily C (CFTR/MRP) protein 1
MLTCIQIYFIYSITNALGEVAAQRGALAIRGALMEAIYRKSLLIRIETAREMGAAKASNLMSVDVRNIVNNLPFIHEVWTAILMTGIGLWIIYIQIGLSFLAAVGGAIVFFLFLPLLVKDIGNARTGWAEATDRRVKFMASVLKHIKAIKMSAYEPFVTDKAVHLRQTEINALVAWIVEILKVSIATNWLGNFLSLITVTTFTLVSIYSRNSGGQVTTAGVFAVISTIQLISNPLLMLGQRWSSLVTAWASFKRIEDFLLCDEKEEFIAVQTGDELQSLGETKAGIRIRLDHASFGVHNQITLLNDLNVNIVTPNLWMLVGRVGSGKSIMLQSLLGELDHISGTCDVSLGTVGFCSQDPWLRANGSIRDNITFMHPYDQSWYSTVIRAVGLDTDLKLMADGDTRVTSSLSGGQRQRVALARAIYGKFDTLVLDDVFSALDADTEAHVFNALFGPSGILRDRSVILATNQVYRLAYASWITMLHEGSIIEQGQYADLMSGHTEVSKLVTEFAAGKASKAAEADITTDLLIQPEEEEKALDGVQDVGSTDGQDQEVSKRGAVAWSTYLLYLRGMGLLYASVWVGLVIVVAAINTSINVYLQAFTTTLVGSSRSEYGVFLGGYAALNIGYLVIFAVAIIYAFKYAHPLASIRLHRWMLVGMLRTGLDFFDSRGLGQVINRFNSDLSLIDMELPNSALNFMFEATTIAGSAILIIIAGKSLKQFYLGLALKPYT